MKSPYIVIVIFFIFNIKIFSQEEQLPSSWTIGTGVSNFVMHGDLTSNSPNLGYYIYLNKMITPVFGFELKGQTLKTKGDSQDFENNFIEEYGTNNLKFEGNTFGAELNLVINLLPTIKNSISKRKFKLNSYFGIGYHTYTAKLYNDDTNELLVDFSSLNRKRNGNARSIYYTSGLGLKYKLNNRLDIELRQSINFNNEDHLDATINSKRHFENFFTTQLGLVINLHKKKKENLIKTKGEFVAPVVSIKKEELILVDTDQDGVIDQFDKEPNTDKDALVYADGVTIDSDKDGVPDHLDKCPLVVGNNKVGCIGSDNLFATEPVVIKEVEVVKPVTKVEPTVKKEVEVVKPVVKAEPVVVKPAVVKEIKSSAKFDKEKALIEGIIANAKRKKEVTLPTNNEGVDVKDVKEVKDAETLALSIYKEKELIASKNPNYLEIIALNKRNIKHNIFELDHAVNNLDIQVTPIYPGCENQINQLKKSSCLITKISIYSLKNFNVSNHPNLELGTGSHLIRIVFVVDENGRSKIYKVIGQWDPIIKNEAKRVIESLPTITPGKLNNLPTPVKYSIELPFKTNF